MGKPGGNNCCLPGCRNYYQKTKGIGGEYTGMTGISYVSFPKVSDNPERNEWRTTLINSVRLRRADGNFNPDKDKICSTHFERKWLTFSGRYFIVNRTTKVEDFISG